MTKPEKEKSILDWLFDSVEENRQMYESWPEEAQPVWYRRSKQCLNTHTEVFRVYECDLPKNHKGDHQDHVSLKFTASWRNT